MYKENEVKIKMVQEQGLHGLVVKTLDSQSRGDVFKTTKSIPISQSKEYQEFLETCGWLVVAL